MITISQALKLKLFDYVECKNIRNKIDADRKKCRKIIQKVLLAIDAKIEDKI